VRTSPAAYTVDKTPKIQTAAELFREEPAQPQPAKRWPPEKFQQGMLITHPEYGAGKIVALSGQGKKRTATVEFFSGEEKRFRLAQSPLQPAVPD
jgi:DNA helicase-2/ATP-dependent DNA helicase PcrA